MQQTKWPQPTILEQTPIEPKKNVLNENKIEAQKGIEILSLKTRT